MQNTIENYAYDLHLFCFAVILVQVYLAYTRLGYFMGNGAGEANILGMGKWSHESIRKDNIITIKQSTNKRCAFVFLKLRMEVMKMLIHRFDRR